MVRLSCQASGTNIIITWGSFLPVRVSNSTIKSRLAESENLSLVIGINMASSSSVKKEDFMRLSFDLILLRLPLMVLISPLWEIYLKGWANLQLGKVLVENLECTIASAEVSLSFCRSL